MCIKRVRWRTAHLLAELEKSRVRGLDNIRWMLVSMHHNSGAITY